MRGEQGATTRGVQGVPTPPPEPTQAQFAIEALTELVLRPDVSDAAQAFNRDLSWLEFNARVLRQAFDERLPLLERVRFLAIFTSNLDEFVMKRVGFLQRCIEEGRTPDGPDAPSPMQMLETVRRSFEHLEEQQAAVWDRSIRPALKASGIECLHWDELTPRERELLREHFRTSTLPVLTPLAVDPGHRFPFISNLSNNLGVLMSEPGEAEPLFARVKVPAGQGLPHWVRVPGEAGAAPSKKDAGAGRFIALHELITHNLDDLFPGMKILEVMPFRVTRAADGDSPSDSLEEEDADNLLEFVEAQIKRRRFAKVVRLEVPRAASTKLVRSVVEMFKIRAQDVDWSQGLLDFRSLFEIADLPRPDLRQTPWTPVVPARLREATSVFSAIRRGDLLVHHPYESFKDSAERFIAEAAADPAVLAIKQTIYRTSRDSPFVQHLIRAAESGKQVACLVEVRARFDEGRNVRLARALEKAGVHVAYGVIGYKTHCKASLVVRREEGQLRCYAHLGTGNYNPSTAMLYTDLGLFTCDPDITRDVVDLFNLLTGRSGKRSYRKLLVAPRSMKSGFLEKIAREGEIARAFAAGQSAVNGRIVAKMNALEDPDITRALYDASRAGASIDLFIRGFCCLRPGVPGLSQNIRVTSVVGRFLEHSRVFHFGAGQADPLDGDWFIGSADWMYRNLEQRVEAVCPVSDRAARLKLQQMIDVMSTDARCAWALRSDGRYVLRSPGPDAMPGSAEDVGTFEALMRDASAGA